MIVGLDFDGVLHSIPSQEIFSTHSLMLIYQTIAPFSPEIIITSSWRSEFDLEQLKEFVGPIGKWVIDVTPEHDNPFTHHLRQRELEMWLEQNSRVGEIWIAIDDERGNYESTAPALITDRQKGFVESDVTKLMNLIKSVFTKKIEYGLV